MGHSKRGASFYDYAEPAPRVVDTSERGFDGPVPTALAGYRGPYVPRKPVLFGQVIDLAAERERQEPGDKKTKSQLRIEAAQARRRSVSFALAETRASVERMQQRGKGRHAAQAEHKREGATETARKG